MRSAAVCRALSKTLQKHVSTVAACSGIRMPPILITRQMSYTRRMFSLLQYTIVEDSYLKIWIVLFRIDRELLQIFLLKEWEN